MAGLITGTKVRTRGLTRLDAAITVDASGDASSTDIGSAHGRIVGVQYAPGDLATGVDITVKDDSGATVLTLTNAGTAARRFRPSAVVTDNLGVAVAAATTATGVDRDIFVGGHLFVTAAQGGVSKSGGLVILVDETAAA